ncbi:hypothetical protein [Actinoplanes sp. NPDC051494]|uniref:hypothetical protein n=1 Tax=Actinoplanes sp. NPDC051494 TaxID=3363907 RepID=UPI003792711F
MDSSTPARAHQVMNELTWDLGHVTDPAIADALRLHAAAHRLAASCDQLLGTALGEADHAAERPPTVDRLIAALTAFAQADPLERGRLAPALADLARWVLATERGWAMLETGLPAAELAREYGITPGAVRSAMSRVLPAPRDDV